MLVIEWSVSFLSFPFLFFLLNDTNVRRLSLSNLTFDPLRFNAILSIVTYGWFLRVAKIEDIDVALDCHYDFHTLNFLNDTFFKWRAAFKISDSRVSSPSE